MTLGYVSDDVVRLLARLGCRYLPLNPGASFRGLHDSLVHLDGPKPEIILCTHEEIAVAAAHAYAKATGEVGWTVVHDLVGLMHASMAVYNAWCDRTPLVVLGGGGPLDPAARRPVDWFHSASSQTQLVRDFVKWDEEPPTPLATLEAIVRAHATAAAAPTGPTYVTLDTEVLERPSDGTIPTPPSSSGPARSAPDPTDVARAARLLAAAERPVIVAGRVGLDPRATPLLTGLAELLAAALREERNHTALPTGHPLNLTGERGLLRSADVVLTVDVHDLRHVLDVGSDGPRTVIDLSMNPLAVRSWSNAGAGLLPVDLQLLGDPLLGLELLAEAARSTVAAGGPAVTADRERRRGELAARHAALRTGLAAAAREGWDDRPIRTGRLVSELHAAVRGAPWLLALRNTRSWPEGVWEFDRAGRFLGHSAGGGIGYGPGAMVGAGLAARDRGELAVGIIGDGDLLYAPGAIWTAVHHGIPMLLVVNNNRTYLNDEHHQAIVARHRGRPAELAHVGIRMSEPDVDFATVARGLGAVGVGPVADPDDLPRVLAEGVERALAGGVVVIDVRTAGAWDPGRG